MKDDARPPFYAALAQSLERRDLRLEEVCRADNVIARRVFEEYGAMFVASLSVLVPPTCVFKSEEEVQRFQRAAGIGAADFGGCTIELQPAALAALLAARAEAEGAGHSITPRDGAEGARRGYGDTLRLWQSRFLPALEYWSGQGRLAPEDAARLRALAPSEQVAAVLELEREGIFFSKDFSKTILQSVAAPGTSPHLSMYAFDVVEFKEPTVQRILARHGWFQTIESDLPHFTFLGYDERELPAHGLRRVEAHGQVFWIPNLVERDREDAQRSGDGGDATR
ncbi:MAG TPA: hypothetical protein VNA19_16325 [Pyrinomonadaceae bacterium]|jgi:hypothetical protein|nr:hypothetical protein [Pyrinomonadaceae bacterium]